MWTYKYIKENVRKIIKEQKVNNLTIHNNFNINNLKSKRRNKAQKGIASEKLYYFNRIRIKIKYVN